MIPPSNPLSCCRTLLQGPTQSSEESVYGCALLRSHQGDVGGVGQRPDVRLHTRQFRRWLQTEECVHLHAGPATTHLR